MTIRPSLPRRVACGTAAWDFFVGVFLAVYLSSERFLTVGKLR